MIIEMMQCTWYQYWNFAKYDCPLHAIAITCVDYMCRLFEYSADLIITVYITCCRCACTNIIAFKLLTIIFKESCSAFFPAVSLIASD